MAGRWFCMQCRGSKDVMHGYCQDDTTIYLKLMMMMKTEERRK